MNDKTARGNARGTNQYNRKNVQGGLAHTNKASLNDHELQAWHHHELGVIRLSCTTIVVTKSQPGGSEWFQHGQRLYKQVPQKKFKVITKDSM